MTRRTVQLLALALVFAVLALTVVTYAEIDVSKCKRIYTYTIYREFPDYGKLNIIVDICLAKENIGNYDWYFYELRIQTVPGTVAYGSDWRNDYLWSNNTVFNNGVYRWLVDYDPTTTVGLSSVDVTLTASRRTRGTGSGCLYVMELLDTRCHSA